MKKIIGLLGLMIVLSGMAMANYTGQLGQVQTSSDLAIINTTCTLANTLYPVTFDAGTVASFTFTAENGDIELYLTNNINGNDFMIPKGAAFWDHLPVPLAKNTTVYVSSPTAGAKCEVLYSYY